MMNKATQASFRQPPERRESVQNVGRIAGEIRARRRDQLGRMRPTGQITVGFAAGMDPRFDRGFLLVQMERETGVSSETTRQSSEYFNMELFAGWSGFAEGDFRRFGQSNRCRDAFYERRPNIRALLANVVSFFARPRRFKSVHQSRFCRAILGADPGILARSETPIRRASEKLGKFNTKIATNSLTGKSAQINWLWSKRLVTTSCCGQQRVNKFQQLRFARGLLSSKTAVSTNPNPPFPLSVATAKNLPSRCQDLRPRSRPRPRPRSPPRR